MIAKGAKMAITLRLDDSQEQKLAELMEMTGNATKAKTIIYMIENGEALLKCQEMIEALAAARSKAAEAEVEQGHIMGNILNMKRKGKLNF